LHDKPADAVSMSSGRRDVLKLVGMLAGQRLLGQGGDDDADGIKIAHRIDWKGLKDDDLLIFQRFGMKSFAGVHYSYRTTRLQLGQAGRDEDIETYRRFLRNMGKLEISVASYDFDPANTYTTKMVQRRGYTTRQFDLEDFRKRVEKPAFDREYSEEDIWGFYTYFVKAVQPVADEARLKRALHPDDPPLAKMNGVAKLSDLSPCHNRTQA
jgi:D-mannonate dehydratase